MRAIFAAAMAASLLAMGAAQAQDATKKCMGCHDMEKKKVGPSFKDAAAKNAGNKDAAAALVTKMKDGKGHPKVAGTDAELKAAADAALAAK